MSIALLAACTGTAMYAEGARPVMADAGKEAISAFVEQAVARGDVPGVVTLIVHRDGVSYAGAAGKQDVARNAAMPPDAIFRIASMTKPVTSVALMMLVEQGKVGLDDPVSKYLPAFDARPVIVNFSAADASYQTRPAARAITIRHLLTNTSGLGYAFSDPSLERIVAVSKKAEPELPLLHDPGSKWTYSPATRVLGWMVEEVSGEPLDVTLRTRIFAPLKMTDTGHSVPGDKVARVVTVHARQGGKLAEAPNEPNQASPVRGDGGLYATAHDYGRFVRMLLNGGSLDGAKILSRQTVRLMGENHIGPIFIETQPAAMPQRTRPFPIGAGKDKFGLGFQITMPDPNFARFRSPGSLSWGGINNTHFWIDPSRGIGVIVLMQVLPFYDEACIGVLRGIEEIVYRHLK
nr:MAG: class A beta-lactamase-related serine hydrolase [Betaproteobacteria bacterium]